jgi:uncharacterized protein
MSVLICPVCKGAMRELAHEGVVIDACVQCRGVWLDRGELEKIGAALVAGAPPTTQSFLNSAPTSRQSSSRETSRWSRDDDDDDRDRHEGQTRQPPSRMSRFMDFFD